MSATLKVQQPPVYRPPAWVAVWFVVSTLLVAWDTGYVLLRFVDAPSSFLNAALALEKL